MTLVQATHPFQFVTETNLVQLTGWRATNLQELLTHLKVASPSVIYYHTHHFLKQHQFLSPEPANDFAYWITNVLQEDRLGEKLAAIDTVRFGSIQELGQKIIDLIEHHLASRVSQRTAPEGEEFHFRKSVGFIFPIPYQAHDLETFATCIKKVGAHSIYHHIFEARMRLEKGENDFSNWLTSELGERDLAKAISRLDPYTQTSEGLKDRIIDLVEIRIKKLEERK
jgi:hypothetical protein